MTRKARKRKLQDEEPCVPNWDDENIFPDTVMREMKSMWEIPQIFHFLQLTKTTLNISHLSMFEMERMLLMPRASKQLANIMTSLLSSPIFKGRSKKLPPMPYEFWTNVLAHKVKGWFKAYEGKHRNPVKVLESIGVEPEFWRIFPHDSILEGKDFEELTFRQRVWLLKTVCDTLMHTRKKVQEEAARQPLENRFETLLGTDRNGERYIYFPQYVKTDLRIYRHSLDNKVLSSVKPKRSESLDDNGSESVPGCSKTKRKLSARDRKVRYARGKKCCILKCEEEGHTADCKCNVDSGHGSPANDDTNLSSTSTCSNVNQIDPNTINAKRSRSSSKLSETSVESNKTTRRITRSSGYDSTTSIESTSERRRSQRMFKGFVASNSTRNSIEILSGLLTGLKSEIGTDESTEELVKQESWKTDDEKPDETIIDDESNRLPNDEILKSDDEKLSARLQPSENPTELQTEKVDTDSWSLSDSPRNSDSDSNDEDEIESLNELRAQLQKEAFRNLSPSKRNTNEYNLRKQKQDAEANPSDSRIHEFNEMLTDLGVSQFQLVADSIDSLKELISSFTAPEDDSENGRTLPPSEIELVESLKGLLSSIEETESSLRDSLKKARTKLQREWTNLNDGSAEDQDSSGEGGPGSNWWIVGSQGCPVPSSSESTVQTVQEPTVSSLSSDISGKPQNPDRDTDNTAENEQRQQNNETAMQEGDKTETNGADQSEQRKKEKSSETQEQETRRVLRTRGVSSYLEQFSTDDEFEANELEERPNIEAVDTTSCSQASTSTSNLAAKVRHNSGLSNQEDSDTDWILPGARKRKNRRPSASRRLKSFQHKIETIQTDMEKESITPGSAKSTSSPEVPKAKVKETSAIKEPNTAQPQKRDEQQTPSSTIISTPDNTNIYDDLQKYSEKIKPKLETITSVHSEIHIKEDNPVCDSTSNISEANYGVAVSQSYVMVNANQPPVSYYVMQPTPVASNVLPPGSIVQAPSLLPAIVPQVEQGFYMQDNQGYIIPQTQAAFVAPPQTEFHVQSSNMMGTQQLVAHTSYVPYVVATAPQMQPCSPPTLQAVPISPTLQNSPRLRGPISADKQSNLGNFAHPTGAVIRSTMPIRGATPRRSGAFLPKTKGRQLPLDQQQRSQAQFSPSGSSAGQKTTSLICLSDSDDEIEMIITEKTGPGTQNQSRGTTKKAGQEMNKPESSTSEAAGSTGNSGLPADILQRMNQGGISVIPLMKPQVQVQATSANPPLVVVVNETGSHYALALPGGNKLILTPEQVAQIRAYNGGKLIT